MVGYGDPSSSEQTTGSGWIRPVFCRHDRSLHSERQALIELVDTVGPPLEGFESAGLARAARGLETHVSTCARVLDISGRF